MKMETKLKQISVVIFLMASALSSIAQKAPRAQWHNNVDMQDAGTPKEAWTYNIIATSKKSYIACGYSEDISSQYFPMIEKLNKFGQTQWAKRIPVVLDQFLNPVSADKGTLFSVLEKSPGNYVAAGKVGGSTIIIEFDDDGNINNTVRQFYQLSGTPTTLITYSIAIDPTPAQASYWICGRYQNSSKDKFFVSKIDIATHSFVGTPFLDADFGGGSIGEKILTRINSGAPGGYDVFACGYTSASTNDNITYSGLNKNGTSTTCTTFDKDIILLSLNSSNTLNQRALYNKSNLAPIYYTETGPLSARTGNPNNLITASPIANQYLTEPVNDDERGSDMIIGLDGNIEIVAFVNYINATLGNEPFQSANGRDVLNDYGLYESVTDPSRAATKPQYKEYADGDAYILKIDPDHPTTPINSKNVGHFSGEDFALKIAQTLNDEYVIAGSSADYYSSTNFDNDLRTPEHSDAYIVATNDDPATYTTHDNWRRVFHAFEEHSFCSFALARTADGGFVIAGNNDSHDDDLTTAKFAPSCAVQKVADQYYAGEVDNPAPTYYVHPTENWVGNVVAGQNFSAQGHANIRKLVIVPFGSTLNITNCDLRFAASDHIYDYWNFNTTQNYTGGTQIGIIVEPGGTLNIDNSTLEGINDCGDRYMWDGIVVQGSGGSQSALYSQGIINVSNHSVIKDARVAAAICNAFRFNVQDPSIPITDVSATNSSSRYYIDVNYMGGVINMQYSTEQDCRFGISFWDYHDPAHGNLSTFTNNTFIQTPAGMADPIFYAREDDGGRGGSVTQLALYGVDGVAVKDNSFLCDPSFARKYRTGFGIIGYGGAEISANSTGNTFRHLNNAIAYLNVPGQNGYPLNIANNLFDDNTLGIGVSGSMMSTTIYQNDIRVPSLTSLSLNPAIGVNLAGCTGYQVSENKFNYCPTCANSGYVPHGDIGISVNNAHDNDDKIKANTFDALDWPAVSLQQNGNDVPNPSSPFYTGLQWRCNDFKSNNLFAIARSSTSTTSIVPATLRAEQGDCAPGSTSSDLANDRFFNACAGGGNEHLYQDPLTTQMVNYNFFQDPTLPELDPNGVCAGTGALYNPQPCGIVSNFDFNTACVPTPPQMRPADIKTQLETSFSQNNAAKNAKQTGTQSLTTEQSLLVAALARSYGLAGNYDSAASMLESYTLYADALPFYMQAGNWAEARRVWNLLPIATKAQQQYSQLMDKSISLFSQSKNWKQADAADRELIHGIAHEIIPSPAVYMARGVVALLDESNFVWPIPVMPQVSALANRSQLKQTTIGQLGSANTTFSLFPNPSTGEFSVKCSGGRLGISNIQGQELLVYNLNPGTTAITLPKKIAAGIYIVKYYPKDGIATQVTRLVYQP